MVPTKVFQLESMSQIPRHEPPILTLEIKYLHNIGCNNMSNMELLKG
jgi:hypothetical protein